MKDNQNDLVPTKLDKVINSSKSVLTIVFIFSFVSNLLNLLTPLYSLQVLDRVLGCQSKETLFFLSLIAMAIYISLHLVQVARSFTLIKLGEWLDDKLSPDLFSVAVQGAAVRASGGASQYLRDLQTVKTFMTSAGVNALFDAPWAIVYMGVLFLIHPWLGWLCVVGAIVMFLFALLNAYAVNKKLGDATEFSIKSMNTAEVASRNAEVIEGMGMMKDVVFNWHKFNRGMQDHQCVASYRNGIISNSSKCFRMLLQMLVTAIGAYLVITQPERMTAGGMIASSIIMGKALQPFDQAIEVWKQVVSSMKSYKNLQKVFSLDSPRQEDFKLPTPEGRISVENVFFAPFSNKPLQPGASPSYTLKGVNFALEPGEILAIIGPSAAGKSSLSKLLVGVWKPLQGVVRMDGADVYAWGRDDFGKHVGYLPQDVELFSGSVKSNIARLKEDVDSELIIEAAKFAGAHDMILRLPNGYETDIGVGGASLSGGQRQRIGLARAFFGNPKFVVLDEPNANLDELGQQALVEALHHTKEKKITTIVVSHRPEILSSVDKILIVQDGSVAAFGSREEILARFVQKQVK